MAAIGAPSTSRNAVVPKRKKNSESLPPSPHPGLRYRAYWTGPATVPRVAMGAMLAELPGKFSSGLLGNIHFREMPSTDLVVKPPEEIGAREADPGEGVEHAWPPYVPGACWKELSLLQFPSVSLTLQHETMQPGKRRMS